MTRPDEVVAGMHRALVPGGRVVGEMGGQGNVEIITGELVGAMARLEHCNRSSVAFEFPIPR